jgi:DNA-binding LytR/AlgR family response regulator
LRPDALFVDINLPGQDGVLLATQVAMLPQPPRKVYTTGNADRAIDAFRLAAVDYHLKPLDPEQVTEAVNRRLTYLRPFEFSASMGSGDRANAVLTADKMRFTGAANELLPVKEVDRDQIRLLARREVAAVPWRERPTWVNCRAARVCDLLSVG